MSYRNTSGSREKSKEKADSNLLTSKTKLSQTATSDTSKYPPVKRDSVKLNPPLPPTVKTKVKQEDLMTQSRIVQAKNGLQLLKKKMSQKGLLSTKSESLKEQPQLQENQYVGSAKVLSRQHKPVNSQKDIRAKPQKQLPIKKAPQVSKLKEYIQPSQYVNPAEQIPIQPKKDFQKMLEEELQREEKSKQAQDRVSTMKRSQPIDIDQYAPDEQLYQCPTGCGRRFKKEIIPKHQKICKKVFLDKRKAFDSAAQRNLEEQLPKPVAPKSKQPPSKLSTQTLKQPLAKQQPVSGVPKWKLQSQQLRNGLKRATGQTLTKQEEKLQQLQKEALVQCGFCGRKFNKNTAERHIPVCEAQSKRMVNKTGPTTNNTKKKW